MHISDRNLPPSFPLFLHTTLQKSIIVYILSIVIVNIPKDRFPNVQQPNYGLNFHFNNKDTIHTHLPLLPPTLSLEKQERNTKEGIKQTHKDKKSKWGDDNNKISEVGGADGRVLTNLFPPIKISRLSQQRGKPKISV